MIIYKLIYNNENKYKFNNTLLNNNILLFIELIIIVFLGGYSMFIKKYRKYK